MNDETIVMLNLSFQTLLVWLYAFLYIILDIFSVSYQLLNCPYNK